MLMIEALLMCLLAFKVSLVQFSVQTHPRIRNLCVSSNVASSKEAQGVFNFVLQDLDAIMVREKAVAARTVALEHVRFVEETAAAS